MAETAHMERLEISVGGLSRVELMSRLSSRSVLVNAHAETLLKDAVFDKRATRAISVTERTVTDLGLHDGVTLPQILESAKQHGLLLYPADTGPYLRMALSEQATSLDSVMSSGRAPAGALTVAADTLSDDADYPKGFYLRVVDGQACCVAIDVTTSIRGPPMTGSYFA